MKQKISKDIEKYRVKHGLYASNENTGNNGFFIIPYNNYELKVMISDGMGWDHVSVSLKNRTPNWKEMCYIKDIFFDEEETVVQYHPQKSKYINNCNTCLHMWKNQNKDIELPPSIMVGI